jgi:hypothetical protein
MPVGFPEVDDMAFADLVKPGQTFPFCDPINHSNQSSDLLPTVRLAAVADVAMRQAAHLVSQGKCW